MITRSAACGLVLLLICAGVAVAGDASMARYDPQQTGYTSEKLEPPLQLDWEFTANKYENNTAAPAVANGKVYFACGDRVYALDLETGEQKWRYPAEAGIGGMVKGTPAVFDNSVYFGAGDGNLYCLDAETGLFKWAYQTRGAIRCPPVISDGVIYVGSDDNCLYAVDATTGDSMGGYWPFQARDDMAIGVAVGAGMAIVACMDGNMYGVAASSGRLRWLPFRLTQAPTNTSPVITENVVVLAVGNMMYGLSARSGQMRWSVTLPSDVAANPAVDGADIYVPCKDHKMYAYSAVGRQVSLKWVEPASLDAAPRAAPVIADEVVYVTTTKGMIYAIAAQDGSTKWRYAVSPSSTNAAGAAYTNSSNSPIVAGGRLLVLTDDGVLHCFRPDAVDKEPPLVVAETPAAGRIVSPAPPLKMSAVLYDIGSGVDFSTVELRLDDQPQDHKIDYASFTVSYTTEVGQPGKATRADLAPGAHTITITAKDYAGNSIARQWYFVTDPSMTPPKKYLLPEDRPTGRRGTQPNTRTTPTGSGTSSSRTRSRSGMPTGGSSTDVPAPPTGGSDTAPQSDGGGAAAPAPPAPPSRNNPAPPPPGGDYPSPGEEIPAPPPPPG